MGNEDRELPGETKQPPLHPQQHILLIDDEAVVREIGCEMLENLGYQCIPAESGEQGIQLYKENKDKIALVILDIEMPGISGDKVYSTLKDLEPTLKILLISGYAKNYLEARYFKQKLNHSIFMSKPFQMQQLSQKLESIMGG
jgi:two-component system cell cycle sensor histidine kinase/response regulator CckA